MKLDKKKFSKRKGATEVCRTKAISLVPTLFQEECT